MREQAGSDNRANPRTYVRRLRFQIASTQSRLALASGFGQPQNQRTYDPVARCVPSTAAAASTFSVKPLMNRPADPKYASHLGRADGTPLEVRPFPRFDEILAMEPDGSSIHHFLAGAGAGILPQGMAAGVFDLERHRAVEFIGLDMAQFAH